MAMILVFTLMYMFAAYAVIPLVRLLVMSNRPTSDLGRRIDELIPKELKITDTVTDNVLLTAWDLNHRSPRFFTKWGYENLHTKE